MRAMKMRDWACAALLLAFASVWIFAQQSTGIILGVVKDNSGAVIPDATVTITNSETGLARTVATGPDGAFRAPVLPVGHYNIRAEKVGFSASVQNGLNLEVAQELVVNFTLQLGQVTQEVEVTAEAPLVNTTTSSLGSMVNEARMADLPLNGRNYVDLTLIQPGISKHPYAATGGFGSSGTWFSANGAPQRSNNYTLDGALMVNALGASTSSENGTTLGVDGIREYKVVTGFFNPEYGLVMGSQMIMVSKSGTNHWHGDAFEYLRNSALDARNFFDYPATSGGRRLPEFRRNNFGGSFGGPIKKDKIFFYGVYEGLRQSLGVSILDQVLPAACHQLVTSPSGVTTLANPSGCAPTLTNSSVVSPVILPFLGLYPSPNLPGNRYSFPAAATQREDYGQMRIDQNFSAADTFFVRYTIDDGELNNPTGSNQALSSGAALPYLRTVGTSRNQFVTLSENHIFSATLLNTARASMSRTNFYVNGVSTINLVGPTYSLVAGQPSGGFTISGYTGIAGQGTESDHIQTIFTFSDDLFYTQGRHALKFGALINRYNLFNLETKSLYGSATFNDAASFMQGIYANYLSLAPGSYLPRFWAYQTYGFYGQDEMRLTSRLTVNYGLRYEFLTIPRARYGLESRFVNFAHPADPAQPWSYGRVMTNPSLHNFSPRVGFAWDVRGDGKTAIRSGFGLYDEVGNFGSAIDQISLSTPPFSLTKTVTSNPTNQRISLPLPYPDTGLTSTCLGVSAIACTNRLQTMGYNLQQPHSLQYNFTVEQQLPGGLGLAVSYVGNRGIHLWQVQEGNPILPQIVSGVPNWFPYLCGGVLSAVNCAGAVNNPAYQRINPAYASVITTGTVGDSWYNALQVNLIKRLSKGLEFQSAYTWSKALDDSQGQLYASDCAATGGLYATAPYNERLDKGPACFDLAHVWHLNLLYHIPDIKSDNWAAGLLRGWWVGNIVSAQTGFPFTPLLNTPRSNNGLLAGQGLTGLIDRVNLGTDTTGTTFACTGTGSAFPGAPACSDGHVTYTYIPYNASKVITGDPNMWFNPLMFRLAPAGQQGNEGRNMLRGPGLGTWDFSLNKDTALPFLGEAGKLQFRVEIFNILNRANFSLPVSGNQRVFAGTLTDAAGASEPPVVNVGQITTTATSSRQIQLALKVIF